MPSITIGTPEYHADVDDTVWTTVTFSGISAEQWDALEAADFICIEYERPEDREKRRTSGTYEWDVPVDIDNWQTYDFEDDRWMPVARAALSMGLDPGDLFEARRKTRLIRLELLAEAMRKEIAENPLIVMEERVRARADEMRVTPFDRPLRNVVFSC